MKVSNILELDLTLTFINKHNKSKDTFKIGDNVYIRYYDCNEGYVYTDGIILALNSNGIILYVNSNNITNIDYYSISEMGLL